MKSIHELQSLKGKLALVTGGAGYLGSAVTETLLELGAKVVIASRDQKKCLDFASELNIQFPKSAFGIELDMTDPKSIDQLFTKIENDFGFIDILVNCAWSGKKNSFESISNEDWNYDIEVCLNGPFYVIKRATEALKKTKGVILNTASMYGHVAPDYKLYEGNNYTNPPSYGAAKAAIIQFTKYLASFLAPHGIRANCISPGPFPFGKTLEDQEFIKRLSQKSMLNRIGKPEDMKGVIAFLCSHASNYVTGQNIAIDGGWTSW